MDLRDNQTSNQSELQSLSHSKRSLLVHIADLDPTNTGCTQRLYKCTRCGRMVVKTKPAFRSYRTYFCVCERKAQESGVLRRHGLSGTPEYRAWLAACQRCLNPKNPHYRHYGGRGITVADEWRPPDGFLAFLAHIGPHPGNGMSLDRIDNDGHYAPGNVRWATQREQMLNTRMSADMAPLRKLYDEVGVWMSPFAAVCREPDPLALLLDPEARKRLVAPRGGLAALDSVRMSKWLRSSSGTIRGTYKEPWIGGRPFRWFSFLNQEVAVARVDWIVKNCYKRRARSVARS